MKLYDYEQEHLDLVTQGAAESTLFLNYDGRFPLKEAGKIAVYGSGVRHTVKGGTGSGEVNSRFSVNIEQGLEDAGFEITTKEWLDAYDKIRVKAKGKFIKQVKAEAKAKKQNVLMYGMGKICPEPDYKLPLKGQGDVAIYVVSRNSGEGMDRANTSGDIQLTKTEIRDILALDKKFTTFMLVLNVGGVVDLTPVAGVKNILLLSQLGVVTGTVLANLLLGKAYPSGKLATTWTTFEEYCQEGEFGNPDETHYKEGIYVGYRYFDSVGAWPLYPFGYGLSYTHFIIRPQDVTLDGTKVNVLAEVKNTGDFPGKEVVQIYLSAPAVELDKPYQELAAFAKTKELAPGEKEEIAITFDLKDMASYSETREAYFLEKGNYVVRIGNSSVDTDAVALIVLDETVETLIVKNTLGLPGFIDFVPESPVESHISANTKILLLSAKDIETKSVNYKVEYPVDEIIEEMTDEELAYMSLGAFNPDARGLAVIGNAASHVAGAAGETTSLLKDKGIDHLIMADGPAGLRLAKEFYYDKKGNACGANAGMLPESMMDYMSGIVGLIAKAVTGAKKIPKNAEIKEQYATAIPIGTALAQTFNYDLVESYGDMVGDEMERFGVHLWLAPALNIHRDIRCGRNFEYYSEDPYVSGMMAAAITEGVQKHPGCGTTIKHFAANNCETNRYGNDSRVSERALREIYLKGFGICVKKAQPHAVMTSYNLLNYIHTSEHYGLTEEVLRNEYGFKGIVMTDWVISFMMDANSKNRVALPAETAVVGGDLFMPGSKEDFDHLMEGLEKGTVTREQLKINATRVYRMIQKLTNK
ncbi:MAG: glycoside hydrolase family 3 C-terminal domain-containing protein [Dorea sp.]|nr:glycoside hydrolase family 3 C-terminal domain-containing protein [Dorea sp.]